MALGAESTVAQVPLVVPGLGSGLHVAGAGVDEVAKLATVGLVAAAVEPEARTSVAAEPAESVVAAPVAGDIVALVAATVASPLLVAGMLVLASARSVSSQHQHEPCVVIVE